jgi:hypothetical protein
MRNKTRTVATLTFAVFVLGVFLFTSGTTWRQCQICGVQEYKRKVLGIPIEAISEREYDEFGTYRKWKKENGKEECIHNFHNVDSATLSSDLNELTNPKKS